MPKKLTSNNHGRLNAQPRFHQKAREIQPYGTVNHALPLVAQGATSPSPCNRA